MKKQYFLYLPFLTLLAILTNACSKQADYTDAIPATASEVVSINLKSLADKAGSKDTESQKALQQLLESMKGEMNAATFQQIEDVMKNPAQSGIDFNAPLYLFRDSLYRQGAIVAKVNDEGKLKELLEAVQKEKITTDIIQENGYNYTTLSNDVLLAFNASTLLATNYASKAKLEKVKETVGSSLRQTQENSFSGSALFKKMQGMNGDINMVFSSASLLQMYNLPINTKALKETGNLKDAKMLAALSFKKGSIDLEMESYTENKEVKELLEKHLKCIPPIKNTFLKYFPESTLALLTTGLDGEKLYNALQESEEIRNDLSINDAEELKEILGLFDGDLTMGLTNVTLNHAPAFLAYATLKEDGALDKLYDQNSPNATGWMKKIIKLDKSSYVYKDRKMNIFFGERDKQMYATNDETLYKSVCKATDPSALKTAYAGNLKGNQGAFVVNVEAILNLPIVQMIMGFGGKQAATYYLFASQVSYLQMTGKGDKATVVMQLKNKDENALKQIVKLVLGNLSSQS